jgi:hypothetical protein
LKVLAGLVLQNTVFFKFLGLPFATQNLEGGVGAPANTSLYSPCAARCWCTIVYSKPVICLCCVLTGVYADYS